MISKTPNSLTTRPLFGEFFPESVTVLISTKEDDFMLHSPDEPFSQRQRSELRAGAGLDAGRLCNVKQVHGNRVVVFRQPVRPVPEADGLVTDVRGLGLAVRTADCLPVMIYDPQTPAVGLVHAGWRGTASRIAPAAVQAMAHEYGSDAARLRVAFGPCIRLHQYEVGPEFREHFPDEVITISGRYYFDLALANRRQLTGAGVRPENIIDCGICTYADAHYHSYRRDADRAGRILTVIMIKE